ncbi:Acetate permease A [Fulvia fulva]|uniref:Acetate permease A n=1 Tax=Passalora fulva TaxID=5499 RepID=A0A9Q8URI6_PASFU|nr:Acetate permease A [Fulvia fulva]KAK4619708.1 Acetate permease A [Fulvia fulva]KAK4620573.1 Acetate permease A [Fulvia fulva]UJO19765.1 Acetate permease A [Fulvia fulva]WPV17594.1 Acetate permease A [Fulvia fulva]WPV32505.1 Acetate permease A [Fulvia fulva]
MAQGESSSVEHVDRAKQTGWGHYGGNPLAHQWTNDTSASARYAAFGGALQPGLYKAPQHKFANPAPRGLAGFALTTFLLSCINLGTRGLAAPNLVVGPAYAYGGLCQLLAGMWEIALGNTFGGTALSSYGSFWISVGITLTPGGFGIESAYADTGEFYAAFGLYLFGWMIFTFFLWILTLRATLTFNLLLLTVWLTFLMLGASYVDAQNDPEGMPDVTLTRAGGGFGIVAAFLAWYNMFAGMADRSNSFFLIPVLHFPWSEKGREARKAKLEGDSNEEMA